MREIRARGTVGSNQWAVDGSVTDTGNPIYANDPHLGLGSPSTFYELHVNTKDRGGNLNATGIGFAGAPGVVQGHNESIAWGSTTNPADVTDWYLEDMSTDGIGQALQPLPREPGGGRAGADPGEGQHGERQRADRWSRAYRHRGGVGVPVRQVQASSTSTKLLAQLRAAAVRS